MNNAKAAILTVVAVVLVAGCVSQQALIGFGAFEGLEGAEIEGLRPAASPQEIVPPTDFEGAQETRSLYWKLNENGTSAVTVWMFRYNTETGAENAVERAYQRLQTQKGFPAFATVYSKRQAGGVVAYTASVLGGRVDVYMFSIRNMAFWVQQTESNSGYAEQLALEVIRLGKSTEKKN